MMIELVSNGKIVQCRQSEYQLGPYPMVSDKMKCKELELKNTILEFKIDVAPFIYNNEYDLYVIIKSKLNPDDITKQEWDEFQITVAKNKSNNLNTKDVTNRF